MSGLLSVQKMSFEALVVLIIAYKAGLYRYPMTMWVIKTLELSNLLLVALS